MSLLNRLATSLNDCSQPSRLSLFCGLHSQVQLHQVSITSALGLVYTGLYSLIFPVILLQSQCAIIMIMVLGDFGLQFLILVFACQLFHGYVGNIMQFFFSFPRFLFPLFFAQISMDFLLLSSVFFSYKLLQFPLHCLAIERWFWPPLRRKSTLLFWSFRKLKRLLLRPKDLWHGIVASHLVRRCHPTGFNKTRKWKVQLSR